MRRDVSRYHPLLVALHWLLGLLIILALIIGYFWLAKIPNANPQKIAVFRLHMIGGAAILALMTVRLIVRFWTAKPPAATTGYRLLDRLAPVTHYGFYILVLLMAATGLATAVVSGLNLIVFGDSHARLPPSLTIYPTRVAHGYIAAIFAGFIVLHVLAALYHQLVLRDGLIRRMSLGRPRSAAPTPVS